MTKIKVGDKFWIFDGNRRSYVNGEKQYEYHFCEVEITGETSRSWIVNGGKSYEFKAPKKEPFKFLGANFGFYKQLLTNKMKLNKIWENNHHYKLIDEIGRLPTDKLIEIAKLIGYEE